jgi:hypothetical protein
LASKWLKKGGALDADADEDWVEKAAYGVEGGA